MANRIKIKVKIMRKKESENATKNPPLAVCKGGFSLIGFAVSEKSPSAGIRISAAVCLQARRTRLFDVVSRHGRRRDS